MSQDNEGVPEQDGNAQTEEGTPTEAGEETKPEAAEEKAPEQRKVWTMPVEKAQEEKRKAAEKARAEAEQSAEERISKLNEEHAAEIARLSRTADPFDGEVEAVASKYNLDPGAAKELLGALEKKLNADKPDFSKYDQILKDREIDAARAKVAAEFDEKVVPIILKQHPQATPEHIRATRERIAELAFTEGYTSYRVEDLYTVKADEFEFKNGFSAESSGGRSSELTDFSKVTDEQEIEMAKRDPDTFRKFLKWQVAHDSKFID